MKTVYFKCKLSGSVVGFTSEQDIKHMLTHTEYEEVAQEQAKKPKGQ